VVEHLLAKEDVASSSLVTRSTEAFGEGGPTKAVRVALNSSSVWQI
jgi:hypothetical protein